MRDLILDLESAGGLARTPWLGALGHTPYRLATALRAGEVIRPRIGWLALPDARHSAFRAIQLGGRLASANALESYGIWVSHVTGLSVHCARNASRLPPLGVGERRTHRKLRFTTDDSVSWRVSVADALVQFSVDAAPREWLASVDSALHAGKITTRELQRLSRFVPPAHRRIAALADVRAASGNETYARVLMVDAGLAVESQVAIPLVGDVDFLVDGWLIVEVDSREFHDAETDQIRDRVRDGNAILLGFATLRFMPEALQDAPGWCLEVVRARLRADRPPPRSGRGGQARRVAS
ncbi:MAG: GxxExxY protein [Actinomycetota bacterium]|nr:GxxExxY protein [Actinomycetota bacterium]